MAGKGDKMGCHVESGSVSRAVKVCLVLPGLLFIYVKLFYDLYSGAVDGLSPNIANDAFNIAWPYFNYARASIHSGIIPLWNPYISLGAPFLADLIAGMFYPINWIIFLIEVPSALLAIQFLTVLIGMGGMHFYTRYLDLAWPARILCVVLFAYAVFTESFHPALGSAFCWFPGILWLTHRFFDSPSFFNVFLVTIVLALCFLAGFPNFFFYTCLTLGVYFLVMLGFSCTDYGWDGVYSRLGKLILALALMLGLVAVQLFPAYELSTLSVRNVESGAAYNSKSFWEIFSIGLMFKNFFLADAAYLYANSTIKIASGIYYLGGALLLLPFCFLSKKYRNVSVALSASFVFIVLFMVSYQVQALSFFQKIPIASSLRVNGRGVAYAQFLLIIMAGVGLSVICERVKISSVSKRERQVRFRIAIFATYVVFLAICAFAIPGNYWFFAGFVPCAILIVLALLRDDRFLTIGCLGWMIALIIIIDVSAHRNNRFLVPAFVGDESDFVAANVRQSKGKSDHYRALFVPGDLGQAYEWANIGPKYQAPNISGYTSMALARWRNYIRYMVSSEKFDLMISRSVLQGFYGDFTPALVKLLSEDSRVLELTSLRYRISESGNTENDSALPRAYAVSHYIQTSDEDESLAAIKQNMSLLRRSVVLENGSPTFLPATGESEYKEVLIENDSANLVELDVNVTEPSIVVLTDAFYPGWKAYVDGIDTKIIRANSVFRAVEVPRGKHSVVFRFSSSSLYWGMVVSLLSAGLIVTLIVGERVFGSGARESRR